MVANIDQNRIASQDRGRFTQNPNTFDPSMNFRPIRYTIDPTYNVPPIKEPLNPRVPTEEDIVTDIPAKYRYAIHSPELQPFDSNW